MSADLPSIPLSVLDLVPVERGSTAQAAVASTLETAAAADEVGLTRFWITEHHNMAGIASTTPAVLLAAVGAATQRIRLGSGGVMLPNHPPLIVSETFSTLATLYPDRIDVGVGRAPGTDQETAIALRRTATERFAEDLVDLLGYLHVDGHGTDAVVAYPRSDQRPTPWLLGSSINSARLAAKLGLPYAFAQHFFGATGAQSAIAAYRTEFRSGPFLKDPYVLATVHVVCGDSDDHAQRLALPAAIAAMPGLQEPGAQFLDPSEASRRVREFRSEDAIAKLWQAQAIGASPKVRDRLKDIITQLNPDELMITNNITDGAEKIASLRRVRDLFGPAALPRGLAQ